MTFCKRKFARQTIGLIGQLFDFGLGQTGEEGDLPNVRLSRYHLAGNSLPLGFKFNLNRSAVRCQVGKGFFHGVYSGIDLGATYHTTMHEESHLSVRLSAQLIEELSHTDILLGEGLASRGRHVLIVGVPKL